MTALGLSPTLARALLPHGAPDADLSSLRTFVTTGEPWNPEPYRWLFEDVGGSRVPVINCTGGTEVGACFLSPTPVGPIKACSVGGPALGMAMDVVDDTGASLVGTGEVGELVCRKPFPGHDARLLARPGQVHRDVLVAHPRRVGARRLGLRRRRRLLVPARPLRRHAEHRRQAHRPRRARVRRRRPPRRARGRRDRRAARGEGRDGVDLRLPAARAPRRRRHDVAAHVAAELGKAFKPDRIFFVDALPKTRSAKIVRRARESDGARHRPGRPVVAREPGVARRDRGSSCAERRARHRRRPRDRREHRPRARRRRLGRRRHRALARRRSTRSRRRSAARAFELDVSDREAVDARLRRDRRRSTCSSRTPAAPSRPPIVDSRSTTCGGPSR